MDTSQLVHLLVARLESFSKDLQEVKSSNKEMANAFSKLLLIEERQANSFAAQERLFKAQEKLDAAIAASQQAKNSELAAAQSMSGAQSSATIASYARLDFLYRPGRLTAYTLRL